MADSSGGEPIVCKLCYEVIEDREFVRLKCSVPTCCQQEETNTFHESCLQKHKSETGSRRDQLLHLVCPRNGWDPVRKCKGKIFDYKRVTNPMYRKGTGGPAQPGQKKKKDLPTGYIAPSAAQASARLKAKNLDLFDPYAKKSLDTSQPVGWSLDEDSKRRRKRKDTTAAATDASNGASVPPHPGPASLNESRAELSDTDSGSDSAPWAAAPAPPPPPPPPPPPVPTTLRVAQAAPPAASFQVRRYNPMADDHEPLERKQRFYNLVTRFMGEGHEQEGAVRRAVDALEAEDRDELMARQLAQMDMQGGGGGSGQSAAVAAAAPATAPNGSSQGWQTVGGAGGKSGGAAGGALQVPPQIQEVVLSMGATYQKLLKESEGHSLFKANLEMIWSTFSIEWNAIVINNAEFYRDRPAEFVQALTKVIGKVQQNLLQVSMSITQWSMSRMTGAAAQPEAQPTAAAPKTAAQSLSKAAAKTAAAASSPPAAADVASAGGPPAGMPYAKAANLCKLCWTNKAEWMTSTCFHKGPCSACFDGSDPSKYRKCCHRNPDGTVCGKEAGELLRAYS